MNDARHHVTLPRSISSATLVNSTIATGVIGFAAEEDDVKNDVTSSGLCTTHGWPMAIARVVWHYSKSDRPVTADFPK